MAKWVARTKEEYESFLSQMQEKANKATQNMIDATAQEMLDIALDIEQNSVDRAPVKTGNLRGSAYVKQQISGNNTTVTVGYNEDTAPYAIVQHEHTEFDANPERQGQSKFLESVLDETIPKIPDMLKRAASKGLHST